MKPVATLAVAVALMTGSCGAGDTLTDAERRASQEVARRYADALLGGDIPASEKLLASSRPDGRKNGSDTPATLQRVYKVVGEVDLRILSGPTSDRGMLLYRISGDGPAYSVDGGKLWIEVIELSEGWWVRHVELVFNELRVPGPSSTLTTEAMATLPRRALEETMA